MARASVREYGTGARRHFRAPHAKISEITTTGHRGVLGGASAAAVRDQYWRSSLRPAPASHLVACRPGRSATGRSLSRLQIPKVYSHAVRIHRISKARENGLKGGAHGHFGGRARSDKLGSGPCRVGPGTPRTAAGLAAAYRSTNTGPPAPALRPARSQLADSRFTNSICRDSEQTRSKRCDHPCWRQWIRPHRT